MNRNTLRPSSFLCLLFCIYFSFLSAEAKMLRPNRLLIYYGYPSLVQLRSSDGSIDANGNTNIAAEIFSQWNYVVLGANLELQNHDDHLKTREIIAGIHQRKPSIRLFGYISIDTTIQNEALEKLHMRVEAWKHMGVDGIFMDNAGYDFQVSRKRLNAVVKFIHEAALSAFVNAWRSEDIMDKKRDLKWNPDGENSLLGKRDFYLLESFIVNTDVYPSGYAPLDDPAHESDIMGRIKKVLQYRKTRKIKVMSIGMADFAAFQEPALNQFFQMQEAAALLFSLDGYGLATTQFSATGEAQNTVMLFSSSAQYDRYFTKNPRYQMSPERTEVQRTNGSIRLIIDEKKKKFSFQ